MGIVWIGVLGHKQGEGWGGWKSGGGVRVAVGAGVGEWGGEGGCTAHCMGADREGPKPKIVQFKALCSTSPTDSTLDDEDDDLTDITEWMS